MSIKNINFVLNHHPNPLYLSGQTLAGKFQFKVVEKTRVNKLVVVIKGNCFCLFKYGHGNVIGEEILLEQTFNVISKESVNQVVFLERGDYSFPFEVKLPEHLPTSFTSPQGGIYYSVNAVFSLPRSLDKRFNLPFKVVNSIGLDRLLAENDERLRANPAAEKSIVHGFGEHSTEPVHARLTLNKNAYLTGETIKFQVNVDNTSCKSVKKLIVSLIKHKTFTVDNDKTVSVSRVLCELERNGPIKPETQSAWDDGQSSDGRVLEIPLTEATMTKASETIAIEYSVRLTVVSASRFDEDLVVELPVIVGLDSLISLIKDGKKSADEM
jgi:hypothetical protein